MPYVELSDGLKRYYEILGPDNGRPVVLLHGWCSSSSLYSEQKPVLANAGYRVFAFDAAGHGRSDKDIHEFTTRKLLNDFKEMGEKLGFWNEPFALIGHSAGGGVALHFGFDIPDHIASLVLINTGFKMIDSFSRRLIWTHGPLYGDVIFSETVKRIVSPIVENTMAAIAAIKGKDTETARLWIQDIFSTPSHVASSEIAEILKYDLEDRLGEIHIPTCVLGGWLDPLAPARQSKRIHELIPDSEVHMLAGSHMMKMWLSDEVNAIILKFLAKTYPPQRPEKPSPIRKKATPKKKPSMKKPVAKRAKSTRKKSV
jgi:3-oxoadipate enol-lactonase